MMMVMADMMMIIAVYPTEYMSIVSITILVSWCPIVSC